MSDVSTFTPRFFSAPGHVLAFAAREQDIEPILPAEAISEPSLRGVAQKGQNDAAADIYYVTSHGTRSFVLPFAASRFGPSQAA